MKVLFVSSSSGSRGGGELYLLFLGEALVDLGVEVALWCSSHSRMDELVESFMKIGKVFRADYKNTYDYKLRSIHNSIPFTIDSLTTAITAFQPNIIHVNKQNTEDGLELLYTLDKMKQPYVTTIHITQTQKSLAALFGGLRDAISRKALQRASSLKWIAISSNRASDLMNFIGSKNDKITMIPNGVKIEKDEGGKVRKAIRREMNIPEGDIVILSVGRLEAQKNPMKFINWAKQCLKVNPSLHFYWVGDGSLRNEFDQKIADLGLGDKIVCLGWQKEVKSFYAMADIYVHTANFEGLPFSLLEAMSWRLPCAVSEELYKDLSFPEDTICKDLKELKILITDPDLMNRLGNCAKEYCATNFSMDVIAKKYLSMYQSLLR